MAPPRPFQTVEGPRHTGEATGVQPVIVRYIGIRDSTHSNMVYCYMRDSKARAVHIYIHVYTLIYIHTYICRTQTFIYTKYNHTNK